MDIQIMAQELAKLLNMGSLSKVYLDKALRLEQQRAAEAASTKATAANSQRWYSPLLMFLYLLSGSGADDVSNKCYIGHQDRKLCDDKGRYKK